MCMSKSLKSFLFVASFALTMIVEGARLDHSDLYVFDGLYYKKNESINFKEINIANVNGAMDEMIMKADGKRTIPQIFFDDQHIGGYDEARALEKENKLQNLLK